MRPYHKMSGLFPSELMRGFFPHHMPENWMDPDRWWSTMGRMRTDIRETPGEYILEAEIPGFRKEDIEVTWRDGHLTIRARKSYSENQDEPNYVHQERAYGELSRSFSVDHIQPEKIRAEYQDGVLKVSLPKTSQDSGSFKKIDIH